MTKACSFRMIKSAVLLVHTVGCCYYPLTGDDGPSTGVTAAVVEADLPGPPAQGGLNSSYYPGQLCSCPALCTEIHLSERGAAWRVRRRCGKSIHPLCSLKELFYKNLIRTAGFFCAKCNVDPKANFNLLTETLQSDNLPRDTALPKWK